MGGPRCPATGRLERVGFVDLWFKMLCVSDVARPFLLPVTRSIRAELLVEPKFLPHRCCTDCRTACGPSCQKVRIASAVCPRKP